MALDRTGQEMVVAVRETLARRLPANVADAAQVTVHQNKRGLTKVTIRCRIEDATSRGKGLPSSGP